MSDALIGKFWAESENLGCTWLKPKLAFLKLCSPSGELTQREECRSVHY